MLRNLTVALTMTSMLLLGACGDDDNDTPTDDGGITLVDSSDPNHDGTTPTPDTGATADLTCMGIVECSGTCTDQACLDACVAQGKDQGAKDAFNALNTCTMTAGTGTGACATQCVTPTAPECGTCMQTECATEITTCQGGGGPEEAGFGDFCNTATPCTGAGMQCLPMNQSGEGFCSKACDNPLGQCTGAPAGTFAGCLIPDGNNGYFCGFVCKLQTNDFPCPSTLVCSTEEDPPGSGQLSCEPPPAS